MISYFAKLVGHVDLLQRAEEGNISLPQYCWALVPLLNTLLGIWVVNLGLPSQTSCCETRTKLLRPNYFERLTDRFHGRNMSTIKFLQGIQILFLKEPSRNIIVTHDALTNSYSYLHYCAGSVLRTLVPSEFSTIVEYHNSYSFIFQE